LAATQVVAIRRIPRAEGYLASFLRPKLFWFGLAVIALGCSCANSFQERRAIFKIGRGNAERLSRLVPIEL